MKTFKSYKTTKGLFKYKNNLVKLARKNRKQATKAESLLWNLILKNKKTGYRFLRQKPIGKYILDFYCSKLLLGIEVDGSSHQNQEDKDYQRQIDLEKKGILIIRYDNELVKNKTESVYYDILKTLEERERELR